MFDIFEMPVKFFPKDIIGKQPKKVGDTFKAFFMTGTQTFICTEIGSGMIWGKLKG